MNDIAIQVENLGKLYRLGERESYKTLRNTVTNIATAPLRAASTVARRESTPSNQPSNSSFWALKGVSFDLKRGEIVGIIGRNGAGKSTLLKILSRVTKPTEGRARVHGRIGSLLEVGTGFHPELTGRENIYLNGTILGMKRREIARKFDEIVAFAEVEKFIDTPVKHYSSGMYMRLAFAVAAHLEPEILLVDEVLAVGDAEFQKKCLGKMGDVAKDGRTVVLVSHNMAAILGVCPRTILIDRGRLTADATSKRVVEQYLHTVDKRTEVPLHKRSDREGDQTLRFVKFELRDSLNLPVAHAYSGEDIVLALDYETQQGNALRNVHVAIGVHGRFDESLFHLSTSVNGFEFQEIPVRGTILCKIPRLRLQPGRYSFNLYCAVKGRIVDWLQNAGTIEVEAGDFFGSGRLPPPDQGPFIIEHTWDVTPVERAQLFSGSRE